MTLTIPEITKDCPREDCCISFGMSSTTCIGWVTMHDKRGKRVDTGDPNITTSSAMCHTCKLGWTATTQRGKTTVEQTSGPPQAELPAIQGK